MTEDKKEKEEAPPLNSELTVNYASQDLFMDTSEVNVDESTSSSGTQNINIVEGDEKSNSNRVEVLCNDNIFRIRKWEDVEIGNVCRLQTRDSSPADMALLGSSSEGSECYITTECFNKSNRFRLRKAVPIPIGSTFGLGDGGDCKPLLENLGAVSMFRFASHQVKDVTEFHAVLLKETGEEKLSEDNFIPRHSILMLTDYIIGIVMYIGKDTKFSVNGGWKGAEEQQKKDKEKEEKEKLKRKREHEEREEERKKAMKSPEALIKILEESTGAVWKKSFTNVEDDGNCLMTAFWLGLKTLLKHYPTNRLPQDEHLPETPEDFRSQFFEKLNGDSTYREQIKNFLQFLVEGIEESYLICMEDFFTLPEFLRDKILTTKQQIYQDPSISNTIDFEKEFVNEFLEAVTGAKVVNGRKVFVPLGATELTALSRLYNVRLQTMSSNEIMKSCGTVTLAEVDPRTIPKEAIQEFGADQERIVRLLNVRANHYQVHLPCDPSGEEIDKMDVSAEYNSFNFWKQPFKNVDNLPPLPLSDEE